MQKKYSSIRKTIHNFKKIVKAYFVSANTLKKKTDDPTELLGWKVSLREMGNDALNTLVYQSIEKNMIKEENGTTLTFKGIILLVKTVW